MKDSLVFVNNCHLVLQLKCHETTTYELLELIY